MKVHHLNQEGLHRSEKDAITTLEKSLPDSWYSFASLELFDRKEGSFETDLIILTHDRIIIAELKKWSGDIFSKNGKWILDWGDSNEERKNPIKQVSRAAKILSAKINKKLNGKTFIPYIDYCVILCGTANKENLPEDEKEFVFTTNEFSELGTPKKYQTIFKPLHGRTAPQSNAERPNQNIKIWERFFTNNSSDFKAKKFSVNNYALSGTALFEHRGHIYSEYLAQRIDDTNYKSLMRRWDFSAEALQNFTQTQNERQNIGHRESKVLGYIDNQEESLSEIHLGLIYTPAPNDITTDFVELYEWPKNRLRLDEFIAKNEARLSLESRLELIKVFVSQVSRLHEIDVAHRDLGKHSVWLSLPSKITLSNFLTASYPDPGKHTVYSARDILKSGRISIPEDLYEDKDGTPFTRDVYLAGAVAHYIAYSCWPQKTDDGTYNWSTKEPSTLNGILDPWFERCLDLEAKNRFQNMSYALTSLNKLIASNMKDNLPNTNFDRFFSDSNIYIKYAPTIIKQKSTTSALARSTDGKFGILYWHGVSHTDQSSNLNYELTTLLERVNALKNANLESTIKIEDFGYNQGMQCLFVIYKWIDGPTWREWLDSSPPKEEIDSIAKKLLTCADSLHRSQFIHGDIHPLNIIIPHDKNLPPVLIDILNFQSRSITPYCPDYVPRNHEQISLASRDRFAIIKIISEASSKSGALNLEIYCQQLLEQPEISEGDFERLIDHYDEIKNPPPQNATAKYEILTKYKPSVDELESDEGIYYISSKTEQSEHETILKVFLCGTRRQIDLHIDLKNETIKKIYIKDPITHHHFIQQKRRSDTELEGVITFREGPSLIATSLVKYLIESTNTKPKSEIKDKNTIYSIQEQISETGRSSFIPKSSAIWKALVDTENETLPKVTTTNSPTFLPNGDLLIHFNKDAQNIDFDLNNEKVQVKIEQNGHQIFLGRLLDIGKDTLRIGSVRRRQSITAGETLRLESSLSAASLVKRQKAVENILEGRAVISDIVEYFDVTENKPPQLLADEPTDEELDSYNVLNEDNEIIFALNKKQREAFKTLYKYGPVSLLQGPPGTGKTSFIGSFIHYAISKGSSRILLVSQSHEAVNNAAEKVRKLFQKQGKSIDIVRLGDESNVSSELQDVQELSLQEHYRELFRAEFQDRVKNIVQPLGLDKEFVTLAVEFESSFGIKLASLAKALSSTDTTTASILADREKNLIRKFLDWTERKDLPIEGLFECHISAIGTTFYNALKNKFDIRSPDAVSRFKQIIDLSSEWLEVMSSRNAHFQNFLTKTRSLVCGTCVGIGRNHYGINENIYDWVIIDEAARSTASEMAIAMQIGRRILLVGDHKQLPPTYEEDHLKAAHRKLPLSVITELERSDFERSFYSSYGQSVGQTLLTQYRMAQPIGELVSHCFYDDCLETGRNDCNTIYDRLPEKLGKTVTWIDTSNAGQNAHHKKPTYANSNPKSSINEYEANTIISLISELTNNEDLLERLKKVHIEDTPIGVICMYAEQTKLLIRKINSLPWARTLLESRFIKVDTVDSYQGKENEIIILSLVRYDFKLSEGFLSSANRANVALSRAKERIYIVGASAMWNRSNLDSAFGRVLNHIQNNTKNCKVLNSEIFNQRSGQ